MKSAVQIKCIIIIDIKQGVFWWKDKKPKINHKKITVKRKRVYLYQLAFNSRYPLIWGQKDRNKGSWDWLEDLVKDKK